MAANTETPKRPGVVWNDTRLESAYANVANATHTREEVLIVFGMNRGQKGPGQPVTVDLTHELILSPFAAKRLSQLLNRVVDTYERAYGTLQIERPRTDRLL